MNATLVAAAVAAAPPLPAQPAAGAVRDVRSAVSGRAGGELGVRLDRRLRRAGGVGHGGGVGVVVGADHGSVDPRDPAVLAAQAITAPLIGRCWSAGCWWRRSG